jgi:hypothetical protein
VTTWRDPNDCLRADEYFIIGGWRGMTLLHIPKWMESMSWITGSYEAVCGYEGIRIVPRAEAKGELCMRCTGNHGSGSANRQALAGGQEAVG